MAFIRELRRREPLRGFLAEFMVAGVLVALSRLKAASMGQPLADEWQPFANSTVQRCARRDDQVWRLYICDEVCHAQVPASAAGAAHREALSTEISMTKFDKPLRRQVDIAGKVYTLTLDRLE